MKKTGFAISVLGVLFFVVSCLPAFAEERGAANADLRQAVAACQYKVRQLEGKFIALEGDHSGDELSTSSRSREAEGAYGSAYWGYLLDN